MNFVQMERKIEDVERKQEEIMRRQDDIDRKLLGEGIIELGGNRLKIDVSATISELRNISS